MYRSSDSTLVTPSSRSRSEIFEEITKKLLALGAIPLESILDPAVEDEFFPLDMPVPSGMGTDVEVVMRDTESQQDTEGLTEKNIPASRTETSPPAPEKQNLPSSTSTSKIYPNPTLSDVTEQADDDAKFENLSYTVPSDVSPTVRRIQDYCAQTTGGRVTVHWVCLTEDKSSNHAAALKLILSQSEFRVYSVDAKFDTSADALHALAESAIDDGVLRLIDTFSRTLEPSSISTGKNETLPPSSSMSQDLKRMTLQEFYESLSRPFIPSFLKAMKSIKDLQACGWLPHAMQAAKGAQLQAHFYWSRDEKSGLMKACLLRISGPELPCQSYLVEALLTKKDMKHAVCLQAISEDVSSYFRSAAESVDQRVTPAMRTLAIQIEVELVKRLKGKGPTVEYGLSERGAYGCTVGINVGSEISPDMRRHTVAARFKNKADAKIAAFCAIAEQGTLDLLRASNGLPPRPMTMEKAVSGHSSGKNESKKRKVPHGGVAITGQRAVTTQNASLEFDYRMANGSDMTRIASNIPRMSPVAGPSTASLGRPIAPAPRRYQGAPGASSVSGPSSSAYTVPADPRHIPQYPHPYLVLPYPSAYPGGPPVNYNPSFPPNFQYTFQPPYPQHYPPGPPQYTFPPPPPPPYSR